MLAAESSDRWRKIAARRPAGSSGGTGAGAVLPRHARHNTRTLVRRCWRPLPSPAQLARAGPVLLFKWLCLWTALHESSHGFDTQTAYGAPPVIVAALFVTAGRERASFVTCVVVGACGVDLWVCVCVCGGWVCMWV